MFSEGIEREHWLHFLMSLKENIGFAEKIRISVNSSYAFD